MRIMSEPVFELRKQIRTTAAADSALARIVANLRQSPRIRWKESRVTQEAVYNAIWLWLDTLDPEVIEDAMESFIPRLESIMTDAGEPVTSDRVVGPLNPKTGNPLSRELKLKRKPSA